MKQIVIAVVGKHNAGKTTTVEAGIKELRKRGFKIAAVKTIHEPDFTIDTKDKDTWRFEQAGATTIIAISPSEITTIENTETNSLTLDQILDKCHNVDIILLEGSRKLQEETNIPKIVVVGSREEALVASKSVRPILTFTGPYSTEELTSEVPYVDVLQNPEKLADLIQSLVQGK
jgi:molybdopterin-guanine dinucleotide biosynthesis protein MobB